MNDFTVTFFGFSITVPNGEALDEMCQAHTDITPKERRSIPDALARQVELVAEKAVKESGWTPRFLFIDEATLSTDKTAEQSVDEGDAEVGEYAICDLEEFYMRQDLVEHRLTQCDDSQGSFLENAVEREVYALALAAWPDTPPPPAS